jgi:uncharacterized Zn-binding protein involved in type VI secretion
MHSAWQNAWHDECVVITGHECVVITGHECVAITGHECVVITSPLIPQCTQVSSLTSPRVY